MVDATYVKVRNRGRVEDQAVLVVAGVNDANQTVDLGNIIPQPPAYSQDVLDVLSGDGLFLLLRPRRKPVKRRRALHRHLDVGYVLSPSGVP